MPTFVTQATALFRVLPNCLSNAILGDAMSFVAISQNVWQEVQEEGVAVVSLMSVPGPSLLHLPEEGSAEPRSMWHVQNRCAQKHKRPHATGLN